METLVIKTDGAYLNVYFTVTQPDDSVGFYGDIDIHKVIDFETEEDIYDELTDNQKEEIINEIRKEL